ncbi:MAG: hypothetical protein M9898_07255 [Chitinophagaceae bacterium]|nr:hypothetical protein [Chitinophagaceae bacterium]
MSKIENKDFTVDLQLKSIELLKGSISLPSVPEVSLNNFNFNISLESKADATNKFLFVIVSVEIRSEDQNHILGSLAVSCIYSIVNFDDVVKIQADGKLDIPQPLVEILNSISISTTRGVMFSTFKGTFLHNAFLPIIDPRSFQQTEQK